MDIDGRPGIAAQRLRHQLSRLQTAPQRSAVYACLFDLPQRERQPNFTELALVDRQLLFARAEGEDEFRHFVGRRDLVSDDLIGFVRHLGLGTEAVEYVLARMDRLATGESPKRSHGVFRPYS